MCLDVNLCTTVSKRLFLTDFSKLCNEAAGMVVGTNKGGVKKSDIELVYAKYRPKDKPAAEWTEFLAMLGALAALCQ